MICCFCRKGALLGASFGERARPVPSLYDESLPAGWAWARDGEGTPYFFHRESGVVTYDDPREGDTREEGSSEGAGEQRERGGGRGSGDGAPASGLYLLERVGVDMNRVSAQPDLALVPRQDNAFYFAHKP